MSKRKETSMSNLAEKFPRDNRCVLLEPYQELMLKALCSALTHHIHSSWSDWLVLDRSGRNFLQAQGLNHSDLKLAINAGVRRGLLIQKTCCRNARDCLESENEMSKTTKKKGSSALWLTKCGKQYLYQQRQRKSTDHNQALMFKSERRLQLMQRNHCHL
jgi:hypothetical protein